MRFVRIGGHEAVSTFADISDLPNDSPTWARWWRSYMRGQVPDYPPARKDVNIVELFGGCGGLAWGAREALAAAGLRAHFAAVADVDGEGLNVYAHNLGASTLLKTDVSSLVSHQVVGVGRAAKFAYPPELANNSLTALKGEVDLLIAGPPCQGHSNLNNKTRRSDPRNLLYLDTVAIAVALDVKAVIIENVPDVVNDHQGVVQTGIALLEQAGFQVDGEVLSALELGLPQTRKRYVLVGAKTEAPSLAAAHQAIGERRHVDVRWAIDDVSHASLDDPLSVQVDLNSDSRRRIKWLFDHDAYDLPDHERPKCHQDGHTYGSVYGRLRWDEPSGTITTGFVTMGRGRFVHPSERRTLTPREAARLQGFPDSFQFQAPNNPPVRKKALTKWIGDAVPPIMGYAAALAVLPTLVPRSEPIGLASNAMSTGSEVQARAALSRELAQLLEAHGVLFSSDNRRLPGAPDFVFPEAKVAVFPYPCIFHGHLACPYAGDEHAEDPFWSRRIETTRKRDQRAAIALRKRGYRPIIAWGCEIMTNPAKVLASIQVEIERDPPGNTTE